MKCPMITADSNVTAKIFTAYSPLNVTVSNITLQLTGAWNSLSYSRIGTHFTFDQGPLRRLQRQPELHQLLEWMLLLALSLKRIL